MKKFLKIAAVSLVALTTSFSGAAMAQGSSIKLGKYYATWGGSWNTNSASFVVAYRLVNMGGRVGLCGTMMHNVVNPGALMRSLFKDVQIRSNKKLIFQDIRHVKRYRDSGALLTQAAPCKVSKTPWVDAYADPKTWTVTVRGDAAYRR